MEGWRKRLKDFVGKREGGRGRRRRRRNSRGRHDGGWIDDESLKASGRDAEWMEMQTDVCNSRDLAISTVLWHSRERTQVYFTVQS